MLRPQKPDPELDFEDETTNGFPILARVAHLYALSSSSGLTISTPPKTRLCNNLIISVLQRRKKQGVEVARKFCHYFHGAFSNSLISNQLQMGVWK